MAVGGSRLIAAALKTPVANRVCPLRYTAPDYSFKVACFFFMSPAPDKNRDRRLSAPISLQRVRQLFSDPEGCAGSQFLRREIAGRMFERLSLIKIHPLQVLDAGCGEGDDLAALAQAFPGAGMLGIDASSAMLGLAHERNVQSRSRVKALLRRWLARAQTGQLPSLACADFGANPLAAASMDLLWSNLALHWHPQPHQVLNEWARVLRVNGLLMFSAFGPDTFAELRDAYLATGEPPPLLPFVDLHDYGDMMLESGFADPVMDMEKLNITYSSAASLLSDVRSFGGNPLQGRRTGLTGRRRYQALLNALESRKDADSRISLTVEVVYGHAFKPLPRKTRDGESIIYFREW